VSRSSWFLTGTITGKLALGHPGFGFLERGSIVSLAAQQIFEGVRRNRGAEMKALILIAPKGS
jgi:hypothetical protein